MNAQGQVWFGDGPATPVQDRPDEIERLIRSAQNEGSPFVTLRSTDGETWRVNHDHIRRIAGPPMESAAPSTTKDHPWR
jgi:hypothetical protein